MMMKKALQGVAVSASKLGRVIASTSNIAAGGGGCMKKAPLLPPPPSSLSYQPLTTRASTLITTKPPPLQSLPSSSSTRPLSTFLSSSKNTHAARLSSSSSSPRPLGLLTTPPLPSHSHTRTYNTQATTTTSSSSSRNTTHSPSKLHTHTHTQRRHFWSPRFLRELGLPWFVQAFYGTLFVIGIAVLAVTLFTASSVFALLFLLAFAGFKLFSKQPHLARQVMRRPSPDSAAGRMFGPLLEMMTDGMLLDGLKNARGAIERDVLGVINTHPTLKKMGQDFRTTGLHKMSMQQVNGEKHVMMEFLVVSSLPREMFVQVVATRTEETVQVEGQEEEHEKWNYESAVVRTPDGTVQVDLTPVLLKKAGGKRTIIIDVPSSREQ